MISLTYFDFVCNLTILLIIFFTALSYATGLFYIAELAEEFPTTTKRVVRYILLTLITLHILALGSAIPKLPLVIGLLNHLSYLPLLSTFPVLPLSSPLLYLSLSLLLCSQAVWWWSMPTSPYASYQSYPYNTQRTYSGAQLLAFYLLFVWLLPLVFFVAGSVSGQGLPMDGQRLEDDNKGKSGRWSIAGIGRWCRRDKGGGGVGREKKEDVHSPADLHSTGARYEPNPAFHANSSASSPAAASYSSYQSAAHPHGTSHNGSGWYGQQQQAGVYGAPSNEGEWMGQQLHTATYTAVRQRSHVS